MTMIPMYKTCPKCKRRYAWNPDVGKMRCPYCRTLGMPGMGDILRAKLKKYVSGEGM